MFILSRPVENKLFVHKCETYPRCRLLNIGQSYAEPGMIVTAMIFINPLFYQSHIKYTL